MKRIARKIQNDPYLLLWIIFVIAIVVFTLWFKQYIKQMIVLSMLFVAFYLLEPFIVAKAKARQLWKSFPAFVLAIIGLVFAGNLVEDYMNRYISTGSINFILVGFWLVSLYFLYAYVVPQRRG